MKAFPHKLHLLALLGLLAAGIGILRADTPATDKSASTAAPAAVTSPEPASVGDTAEATETAPAPSADKAEQPEPSLRSLTNEAPKASEAEEVEAKAEPAATAEKEDEEAAPEAKAAEAAPEVTPAPTPAPEEPKPAKKGKTHRVHSDDQIPLQHIVIEEGQVTQEAVSVGASTTIKGEVTQNAVAIFGSNKIATHARVRQEAVSVFGNLDIDGEVGKAVTIFGNLKLGPNAIVHGETVIVFGSFEKDPAAQVGKITPIFAAPAFGAFGNLNAWFHTCLFQGRLLAFDREVSWAWVIAGAHLLLYVFISLLFGKGTVRAVENLEKRPGMSLLCALLTFLLTPLVIVILAIGTVTAVLIPVLIIGLFFLSYFGRTVIHAWFGRLFARFLPSGLNTPVTLCVLMGAVVISLLYCVPLLGILLHSIFGSIGVGAAVLTIADSMKREPKGPTAVPAAVASSKSFAGGPMAPQNPAAAPASVSVPPVVSASIVAPQEPIMGAPLSTPAASPTPEPVIATPLQASPVAEPGPVVSPIIPAAPSFNPRPPASDFQAPAGATAASLETLPRAGFWLRIGALCIDFLLVVITLGILGSITPDWAHIHTGPWILLVLAGYGAALWKHRGTTIGGIICRIQVVRTDGREIDWTTACIRGLGCVLSAFVGGLGFIWIAVDRDQESWHDKIAGTAVVRVPKSRPLV